MATSAIRPTGREITFSTDSVIVSKTDLRGVITYVNGVFLDVSGYREQDVLGRPHNILRHPDMPRCVFKLLWDMLHRRREVFAYVVNLAKTGDHYWVFAHVTPSLDSYGNVVGYHSNRRSPDRKAIEKIAPVYRAILEQETRAADPRTGMLAGETLLTQQLERLGCSYDEFVFSLSA